ncbi:MAG: chromosome segregation protein SMC [Chitinispirillales bacterium]|jgi:chromosome segregation protein|nr:chromosome segregation protein SMC [Chitinispirillales bacterium]
MILSKLSIYGFKSFADKTELEFGEGMTAVIGPNGCGKSNVVDAIRWVFGEQKASALRSTNMQEVIFSGTQKRAPLNMAEVTLVIENTKGILPVEYREVSIARRIYRSGESEYRLNKVPCRLKDIQNIFLDTGVGSSAYTTIENKMIEKILSDRADERRVLFEEAAGIGKYKQMRKESLSKLDKTRQDLLRINDKTTESERHVRMLARHVEKARKYKDYYDALKALEIAFENRNYVRLTEAVNLRKIFLKESEGRREQLRAAAATAESRVEKMRLDALEAEKELEAASRSVAESSEKIVGIDKDASIAAERMSYLNDTIARLDADAADLDRQTDDAARFKMQIEKSVVEREAEHVRSAERTAGASEELAQFDNNLNAKKAEADQLGRDQIELINMIGDAKSRLGSANSALNNALEKSEYNKRDMRDLEIRFEEYNDAIEVCRQQLNMAESANRDYMQSRETLLGRIEREDERYRGLVGKEKHLEAQIATNKSQLKFLEGLDAAFEGYETGVKALLTAGLPGMRGIVADLIGVTDEAMLPIVEKLAGSAVQTVVFDTDAQLESAVEFLRGDKKGSARIVSLERLSRFTNRSDANMNPSLRDVKALIKTADGCEVLAEHFFGRYTIANDYKTAIDAARNIDRGCAIISVDSGVICRGDGSVIAGDSHKETAGLLQRKQEIEKITANIGEFETNHLAILTEKDTCIMSRDEAKLALIEVDEKINSGQRRQQEQQTTIRHNENEMRNIEQRMEALTVEMDGLTAKTAEVREQIAAIEAEAATLYSRRDALNEQTENARNSVRSMDAERITLAERLKNIELETHGLANRIANDKRDIERLASDIEQFGVMKQTKIEDKGRCRAEISEVENRQALLREDLENAKTKRSELEATRDAVREDYSRRLSEIEELRKELRSVHNDLEETGNAIHDAELKQTNDEQERRRSREKIWEAYELDLEDLEQEGVASIDEDNEAVTREIQMYKERIKHVGQVNMAALEDHETENARLIELTAQRDDLQSAVDELEKAITKLDKEARVQFLATFELVQKNFTEMFTTLFEGGEASISLEEGVDPLEAGIHINVRPAGKKMRGVQLLSGGERALTAISLLFALYLVKPSAYCILDELDAPLDDANIGRFVRVLKKFAEKTQFIIITHNKGTMEAADLLYGVTQQESGVSTIVSVKFEEAGLRAA